MDNQRNLLIVALVAMTTILYMQWLDFSQKYKVVTPQQQSVGEGQISTANITATPGNADLPVTPTTVTQPALTAAPQLQVPEEIIEGDFIEITTDLIEARINLKGGVIGAASINNEPISIDTPDVGYRLLKQEPQEIFVAEDGLLANGVKTPNHAQTIYSAEKKSYVMRPGGVLNVPLFWTSEDGVTFKKTFTFRPDTYVVDVAYEVTNNTADAWQLFHYGQFTRSEPPKKGGGFGQLPAYVGGVIYSSDDQYQKVDFGDMRKKTLAKETDKGWVGMMHHYFVSAWLPKESSPIQFYSATNQGLALPTYRIGYKTLQPVTVAPGTAAQLTSHLYVGSKETAQLKAVEKNGAEGFALTVDYGMLTFIASPLFVALDWINSFIGNWGWSIIILTLLIKLAFYPLSAASYKSMAGMKKLQPRIQTLKDRYKDDRQKFQMEMMELYKKEKINPAGGCLPILIQIPVFIALYWVLLESVEMRQAPFALWLQDLSVPDPYFVLPILMGASMFLQQRLNPAPMDDIQRRVMMFMPIVLTVLFLGFPQGLVLYWVVNNLLSIAQQWWINKRHAV